jgi:hypothetical protein
MVDDVTSFVQTTVETKSRQDVVPGDELFQGDHNLAEADELLAQEAELQMQAQDAADDADTTESVELATLGEEESEHEHFTLVDTSQPTPPPGCVDKGCYGRGPFCGGSDYDCTSRGFVVTGYYETCGTKRCSTGYKVRCAQCSASASVVSVAAPTAAPAVAPWVEPTEAPPAAVVPPTAPPAIVLPTDAPVFAPIPYDATAIATAEAAVAAAKANYDALKANFSAARKDAKEVNVNITFFARKGKGYKKSFLKARKAAVGYAKKVQMANITIFKAQTNMHNAYFAQKGAEQGAQDLLANATNYNQMKRYWEKQVVDAKHSVAKAQRQVNLGRAAVKKASYDAALAEKSEKKMLKGAKSDNKFKAKWNKVALKQAKKMYVKKEMENAFVAASSSNRNTNNTPAWGGKRYGKR